MKSIFMIFVFCLFTATFLFAQERAASFKPEKPQMGDKITVTYNPDVKNALFKNVNEITLFAALIQSDATNTLVEVKMGKKGNQWEGSFVLQDTLARVMLFRFDSGDLTDDNNGDCSASLVYNKEGNPVKKSHYTMQMLFKYGEIVTGFPVVADKEKAKKEAEEENKLYPPEKKGPDPLQKLYQTYNANKSDKKIVSQVVAEIVKYYKTGKLNENEALGVTSLLRAIKQPAKADQIAADYLKNHPKGNFEKQERLNKIYAESDKVKRISLIKKILKESRKISDSDLETINYMLVQALISLKKYDEAYNVISKLKKPDASMYNSLAWGAIEKGEILEKAVKWAKIGVDILRNPDQANKPANITLKDWKKSNHNALIYILDTYGYGLFQLGKTEEAEKCYEEVYAANKSALTEDYNARYIECLNKNGKYAKAVEVAEESMALGKSSGKLLEEYKTAFIKSKGSIEDFNKKMAAIKEEEAKKASEKLVKGLINKPAPQFMLKGIDGKTVSLADLKGKVVVVDFWATWCGPCKASFPTLQKVYEKYKNNENIVIYAVNTWENETGKEREKTVTEFLKENKYTFNVLYDAEQRENSLAAQFGVDGIPTKFIIDKEGNIQFKSVGFMGEKIMMDEMDAQFEMLVNNRHKAYLKN